MPATGIRSDDGDSGAGGHIVALRPVFPPRLPLQESQQPTWVPLFGQIGRTCQGVNRSKRFLKDRLNKTSSSP